MQLKKIFSTGRASSGLPIRKAAKAIGLSPSYLHDIEMGRANKLKMKYIYAAANVYGISPDVICAAAERIPQDVFYKIIRCPELLEVIRKHKE